MEHAILHNAYSFMFMAVFIILPLSMFQHVFKLYRNAPFYLPFVLLLVVELFLFGDLHHSYFLVIISCISLLGIYPGVQFPSLV